MDSAAYMSDSEEEVVWQPPEGMRSTEEDHHHHVASQDDYQMVDSANVTEGSCQRRARRLRRLKLSWSRPWRRFPNSWLRRLPSRSQVVEETQVAVETVSEQLVEEGRLNSKIS